jgi:hypothetical protein
VPWGLFHSGSGGRVLNGVYGEVNRQGPKCVALLQYPHPRVCRFQGKIAA